MTTSLTLTGSHQSFDTSKKKFGGGSLAFDGNQDPNSVTGGKLPSSGDLSLRCWVNTSTTNYGAVFGQTGYAYLIVDNSGQIYLDYGDSNEQQTPRFRLNDGAWHFVRADVGANGAFVYVDGVQVATNTVTLDASGPNRTRSPITVGTLDGVAFRYLGNIDEIAVFNTTTDTPGTTVPTSAYTGTESGLSYLYHLDTDGSDSTATGAAVTIKANDPAIVFSPGNWTGPTTSDNRTANCGAYFRTMISGSCKINIDTSNLAASTVKVAWRVDGQAWNDVVLSAAIPVTVPAVYVAPWHELELLIVAQSSTTDRWSAANAEAFVFTSITSTSSSFAVKAPAKKPGAVLFFGDSITEGLRAVSYTGATDLDKNDVRGSYAYLLAQALGCEFGIIAYGGQGWIYPAAGTGQGLKDSYNLVYTGYPRAWPTDLRAVFVNMGTNGGNSSDSDTQAAIVSVINGMYAATTSSLASIVLMRPFGGNQATLIQAARAAAAKDRVFYMDTTGVYDPSLGSDDTQLHPTASNARGFIVPALIPLAKPYARLRTFTLQAAA